MQTEIIDRLHETTTTLLQTIDNFPQEKFNTIPFEGSWTAAQVSEHILKAESGVPPTWLGNAAPTEAPTDEKIITIQKIFLDFNHKMQSPEFLLPGKDQKDKAALYNAIKANRVEIERLATSLDMAQTFTDFELPGLGTLTGIEWTTFIDCHAKRHIFQLQKIYEIVK